MTYQHVVTHHAVIEGCSSYLIGDSKQPGACLQSNTLRLSAGRCDRMTERSMFPYLNLYRRTLASCVRTELAGVNALLASQYWLNLAGVQRENQ